MYFSPTLFLSDYVWILAPHAFLFTVLYFPQIFYASFVTRTSSSLMLLALITAFFQQNIIVEPMAAYIIGASVVWLFFYGNALILFKNPSRDFKRISRVKDKASGSVRYAWEPFPDNYIRRIYWVTDLISSPRGLGWSHQYRKRLDCVPVEVRALYLNEIDGPKKRAKTECITKTTNSDFESNNLIKIQPIDTKRSVFVRQRCIRVLRDIAIIHILSYITSFDAFLNGTGDMNPFTIPYERAKYWILLLPYRVTIGLVGSYVTLDFSMSFSSLICVGLLGPHFLGAWGEPWMNPSIWGSVNAIYERGIAGFWGSFWHDALTYGLVSFSAGLFGTKNISTSSQTSPPPRNLRYILRFHSIFIMSGILHAAGSYAHPLDTHPWLAFWSFSLQGVGIFLQESLRGWLLRVGFSESATKALIFISTIVWSLFTGPLFLADLASGRMTGIRIIPLSFMEIIPSIRKKTGF